MDVNYLGKLGTSQSLNARTSSQKSVNGIPEVRFGLKKRAQCQNHQEISDIAQLKVWLGMDRLLAYKCFVQVLVAAFTRGGLNWYYQWNLCRLE